MRRKNKKTMYVALAALVLMISVGYALLSANLRINGTSRIDNVTWDVHFENAEATANSTVTPTTAPSAPAASKLQTISYDVTFDTLGQVYEFTVDVVNDGTIDAMIESFTSKIKIGAEEETTILADKSNLPAYLDYDVTYEDGTAIANNHLLAADDSETIKVRVEFKRDITNAQLEEASGKTIILNVGINYVQADENATASHPVPTNYVVTTTKMQIGQTLPNGVTLKTASQAMADWTARVGSTKSVYLKQVLNASDEIEESYACFERNSTEYCIKGGDYGTAFLANAKFIYDAFEGVNCSGDNNLPATYDSSYNPNPTSSFYCRGSDVYARADSDGNVRAYEGDFYYRCGVTSVGSSFCEFGSGTDF